MDPPAWRDPIWRFLDGGGVGCVCARIEEVCELDREAYLPFPEERERAGSFHRVRDRDAFFAGRILARSLVVRDGTPGDVVLRPGPRGKPGCAHPRAYAFNLSHAKGWVALALAKDREVGVDIESLDRRVDADALAARAFSPRERAVVDREGRSGFLRIWTRKESLVKAEGTGIARRLAAINTLAEETAPAMRWVEFRPAQTHVGCVAYAGETAEVRFWRWFPGDQRLQTL